MGKKFIDKNYLVVVKENDHDSINTVNEEKNKEKNENEKKNEENKEENEKGIKLDLKKTKKYKLKKFCWFYHIFVINIKW